MSEGVLIFEGMTVGILPGDFSINLDDSDAKLILSTAYNVIPIWLRIAHDNYISAKNAYAELINNWNDDSTNQKSLLIAELTPSMQVIVACGIAFDGLYDMLKPHARLPESLIESWKANKTGRAKQISEVVKRVYSIDNSTFKEFRKTVVQIINFRDMAVHPTLRLKNSCTRPDLPVGVDWKFSAYKFSNASNCFDSTLKLFTYLYEKKCTDELVSEKMNNIFKALQELGVVTINA